LDEEDFGGEIDLEDEGAFNAVLDEYLLVRERFFVVCCSNGFMTRIV